MSPERNAPCPCGSGKKYKRCCGAPRPAGTDAVTRNRALAYQGAPGERREAFCREYTAYKKGVLASIAAELARDVQAEGKSISCGRGCNACCRVYVAVTLQECEAIVYYLYQHEEALQNFLTNYTAWQEGVRGLGETYKQIGRLRSKQLAGQETEADRAAFDAALTAYAGADIPCPFLKEGACAIYEVRPYVCAGLVATTPAEWCDSLHPHHARINLVRRGITFNDDLPYLGNQFAKVLLSNLPALVYALLVRGWDFLRGVPGAG